MAGAGRGLLDLRRLCWFGHFKLPENLMTVRELLSGIGEAHSAYNLMLRLRRAGVDAAFVALTGWRGSESVTLDRRIADALAPLDLSRPLPIVTGYAHCEASPVRLYVRGHREITFSRIAVHLGAAEPVIPNAFPPPPPQPT